MAKKMSKTKRLEALRNKLKETDMGGSKGFWSPQTGMNTVRILPETGDMGFFFQEVGRHYLPGKKMSYCPDFTSDGELDCPVCELVSDLYGIGDTASRKLAGEIRVRKMYWMNIVVREGDKTMGPFIYTPGVTVFSTVASLINDPDYGDITDPYEGTDLTIERSGTGLNTEYQVVPKRKVTPVAEGDEEIEKILEKCKDLSWVEVGDDPEEDQELSAGHAVYLLPYDRIVNDFDLDLDPEDLADEDEDEEEEHPAKQDVTRRRRRRARR